MSFAGHWKLCQESFTRDIVAWDAGDSKPEWLPNVPYVDTVSLYLNCDLEGMNGREVRQQISGVCAPLRTMPVKRGAGCCPSWIVSF